mgnify:CR=1 FL=1
MKIAKKFQEIDEDDKKYPNVQGVWLEDDYQRTYLTTVLQVM